MDVWTSTSRLLCDRGVANNVESDMFKFLSSITTGLKIVEMLISKIQTTVFLIGEFLIKPFCWSFAGLDVLGGSGNN